MSIFLYERVSHKSSELSGISIPQQIAAGMRYISTNIPNDTLSQHSFSSDISGVFCDRAVSGWSKPFATRPAARELLSHIRQGDHIVFYSVDRAARNMRDFCNMTWEFDRLGVNCHYIIDQINSATAVGKFQLHMKASAAQFFSDLISERTREALAIKRILSGKEPCVGKPRTKWVANVDVPQPPTPEVRTRPVGRILRYERVSHNYQYISGLGLEHQSTANAAAAERLHREHGGVIDKVFVDPAVSAFKKRFHEREAGRALMEYAQPGDDVVIYRIDRAWRNPADAMDMAQKLLDRQVYLHFVCEGIRTDTQQGAEWISVLASMAHMESTMRSIRTKQALKASRAMGRPGSGQMPAGWKGKIIGNNTKKMVVDMKNIAKRLIPWVMVHELGMSYKMADECLLALRCFKKEKKATLADKQASHIGDRLKKCERIRKTIPEKLWNKALAKARRYTTIRILRHHWYRPKWQGERMSFQELAYSLSSR